MEALLEAGLLPHVRGRGRAGCRSPSLPSFWERAGGAFLAAGSPKQASAVFGRAPGTSPARSTDSCHCAR
jgi:hypothetical protein